MESVMLAPYAGSPKSVIREMLKYAEPKEGELLVDIGSGRGNVIIHAAKEYPIRCIGIESDHGLVEESRARIKSEGLDGRVSVHEGDALAYNLSKADIVTAYLTWDGMRDMEKKVYSELKHSARVVSHDYEFPSYRSTKYRPFLGISAYAPRWLPFPSLHWIHLYRMDDRRKAETFKEFFSRHLSLGRKD